MGLATSYESCVEHEMGNGAAASQGSPFCGQAAVAAGSFLTCNSFVYGCTLHDVHSSG
jgi:hypothetical protein